MGTKRHALEQIIFLLREAEGVLGQGKTVQEAVEAPVSLNRRVTAGARNTAELYEFLRESLAIQVALECLTVRDIMSDTICQ